MWVFCLCVRAPCTSLIPTEVRRGHQILWNWSDGWLSATIWMLGIEPGSSIKNNTCSKLLSHLSSPLNYYFIILCVCMFCLYVCLCTGCGPDAHQKRASDLKKWSCRQLEVSMRSWELNLGPPAAVFLTAEPSPQPHSFLFFGAQGLIPNKTMFDHWNTAPAPRLFNKLKHIIYILKILLLFSKLEQLLRFQFLNISVSGPK